MNIHAMGILTALAICVSLAAAKAEDELPKFCRGVACPEFEVVKRLDDNSEIRCYGKATWVAKNTTGSLTLALTKAYYDIERYLMGNNKPGIELSSGKPTAVGFYTKAKFAELSNEKVVATYLPEHDKLSAPEPLSEDVFIYEQPKNSKMAVRAFGGFATERQAQTEAGEMAELLDKEGIDYKEDFFMLAIYDSPTQLRNRHNEVWLMLDKNDAEAETATTA